MGQADESAAAGTERPRIVHRGCHRTAVTLVITGIVMFSASLLSMLWVDVHRYSLWFLMLAVIIIGLGLFYEQRAFGHSTAAIWKNTGVGVLTGLSTLFGFAMLRGLIIERFGESVWYLGFVLLVLGCLSLPYLFPRKGG